MASSHQLKNYVFLSFRGEDTRRGFVSHLCKALTQNGIQTFIDDNLSREENISEELLKVIENSIAAIIVFSQNYASSSWCLDELAKIIECTKKVLPVFYQVDPSEVRKQRGVFGKVLTKLEKKIKDKTKVQRWRDALNKAVNISGWDNRNSCTESELVHKIVEEILNSVFIQMPSNVATMQLVGINSHMEAVTKLLDVESNDVRMVRITGLGGIGKTTIAKAIYNSFSNHFKAKSFVENVREWSKTEQGIIHLQETLLKGISEDNNLRVDTIYEGTTRINKILRLKKVLIILDDVDNADQIDTLFGCECFAFGSRIILTTRNKSLRVNGKGLLTYDYGVKELDEDEAIELFRKHAFPSNEVPEDYLELEKQAIRYAKGLPLALKVMGRDLCEQTIDAWNESLNSYKTNLHEDIQNILRRSYEGLTEDEKNIFLDIACFFKGYDMSYNMIKDVLKACGLNPYGIQKLIDKCLLTIDQDNYYLSMHDLLQQMGMDIVRQEAPQKLGERSRLWCYMEALDVLTEDMGLDKIQSIILWPPKSEPVEVQRKAQFCKMKNLRLLLIRNVRCCNGPLECLPNGLSLLDWHDYPFSSWPANFFPKKLVVLNMPFILLKEPALKQNFVSVTYVDFSGCDLITKIPDLSMTPNVTNLILKWCTNLVEIDDSVGRLDKLNMLDLEGCGKLETHPNCLTMKSLTLFNLVDCKRIKKFSNILHEMKGVEYLHLLGNCTNELPPSFGNLIGLKGLYISLNSGEAHLPGSIYNLQHIEMLDFYGNVIFPKSQTLNSKNEADVLTNTWSNQDGVQDLSFESIEVSELSELMEFSSRVHSLKIEECDDLEFIPQGEVLSSPVIKKSKEISETEERGECEDKTDADMDTTLKAKVITPEQDESNEEDPSPSLFLEEKSSLPPTQGAGESSLPMSQTPNSRNEADVLTNTWSNQDGVQDLSFESLKVSEISELMDLPTRVHSLKIEGCDDLEFIPEGVMSSELSLQDLYIINCCSLKSFPKDHPPTALKILYIRNCKKLNFPLTTEKKTHQDALLEYLCIGSSCDSLKSISLDLFPNLKSLSIWDCANLELLSMPVRKNLTSLEALEIRDCPNLVSFLGGGLRTMNLTSVWLSNCKKLEKLPELHTLDSLQSLFINNCPELESLSEKGLPSRLSLFSITFCNKLKLKDEWGLDGLDYLRRLEIEGGCVDVQSFPEKFLPSNLSSLRISGLLNLKNLDEGFQQLTALQRLEISCCPNLQSLPEVGFPSSLSFLCIKECPLLTSKFRNKKGKDWSKIDHISCIEIDEEVIS